MNQLNKIPLTQQIETQKVLKKISANRVLANLDIEIVTREAKEVQPYK